MIFDPVFSPRVIQSLLVVSESGKNYLSSSWASESRLSSSPLLLNLGEEIAAACFFRFSQLPSMERARQGQRLHKPAKTVGIREGCCRCHRRQRIVPVVLNGFAAAATSRICREEILSGLIYWKEQRIHRWSLSSDRRGVVRASVCTLFVIGDKKGAWFTIETKKGKRQGGFGPSLWAGDRMFVVTKRRSQCRWSPVMTLVQGRHRLRRNPREGRRQGSVGPRVGSVPGRVGPDQQQKDFMGLRQVEAQVRSVSTWSMRKSPAAREALTSADDVMLMSSTHASS